MSSRANASSDALPRCTTHQMRSCGDVFSGTRDAHAGNSSERFSFGGRPGKNSVTGCAKRLPRPGRNRSAAAATRTIASVSRPRGRWKRMMSDGASDSTVRCPNSPRRVCTDICFACSAK